MHSSLCLDIRLLSYLIVRNLWSSLIPLSRGSFDVIVGIDWLSKRKFVIVCYEKVVRIPLDGDEIFRVHGERTLGAAKALMNAKVDEPRISDIPVVQYFIDVFPGDLSMTTTTTTNVMGDALSRKERVKSRRVRGMILAAQSEAFKQENVLAERLHGLDQQMERKGDESLYFMDRIWVLLVGSVMDEAHASRYLVVSLSGMDRECHECGRRTLGGRSGYEVKEKKGKEWNSGDDQLRLRWMIYLVVLADAAESVRDTIGFDYIQAFETTDKVVLIKEKLKAARDRQKSYADNRRKPLEFEVGDRVMLKVSSWKGCNFALKRIVKHKEPVEIMDREVKSLKRSRFLLVKVHWNSKCGPKFHLGSGAREGKDHMKSNVPKLFVDRCC
ncbi:hypothetical protein Tco_1482172 [Tanacetum coccineum]